MTEDTDGSGEQTLSWRIVQIDTERTGQMKLDPPQRIPWTRLLAEAIGKRSRREACPIDIGGVDTGRIALATHD